MPVNGHHRKPCLQILVQVAVGERNQPVHLVLPCHVEIGKLPVRIVVGIAQQQPVAQRRKNLLHIVDQHGEKGVDQIRNEDRHRVSLLRLQPSGIGIHPIIQLFDGSLHLFPVSGLHVQIIQYLGDRSHGYARIDRHVPDRCHFSPPCRKLRSAALMPAESSSVLNRFNLNRFIFKNSTKNRFRQAFSVSAKPAPLFLTPHGSERSLRRSRLFPRPVKIT